MAHTVNAHFRRQPVIAGAHYWGSHPHEIVLPPRMNLHPGPSTYWRSSPFINRVQGTPRFGSAPLTWEGVLTGGGYDPLTYHIRGDIQQVGYIFPRSDAGVDPGYYGDSLYIRWDGQPNGINVAGRSNASFYDDSVSNQIIIRWSDATLDAGLEVQVVGDVYNLLVCREDQVADYDAGFITTQEARSLWANATDTRYMQIQGIHPSHITRADQLCHFNDPFWVVISEMDHSVSAGARSGFPLQACFKMSEELGTDPWVCMPGLLGAPDINLTVDGVTDWRALGDSYAASFVANTSEISNWCALSLTEMDAAQVSVEKAASVTINNEVWNHAFPYGHCTQFYNSVGNYLTGSPSSNHNNFKVAYGYQAAKLAHQMQLAKNDTAGSPFDRTNQPIKILLEYQAAAPNQIDQMEQGILLYEAAHGISLDRSQFEVSGSNYIKGIFSWFLPNDFLGQTYSSSEEYFVAFWAYIESHDSYISNDFGALYDQFLVHLTTTDSNNSMRSVLRWIESGFAKAVGYGMGIGCHYEGGSHEDTVVASASSDLNNQPKRLQFYRGWIESVQHANLWVEFYRLAHVYFSKLSARYGVADFYRIAAAALGVSGGDNQPWFERDKYSSPNIPVEDVNNGVARRRRLAEAMI